MDVLTYEGILSRKGPIMNVNGVTGSIDSYASYTKSATTVLAPEAESATTSVQTEDVGAVYETGIERPTQTYKANAEMIQKLKADADARTEQLRNLVQQLITKQGKTFATANDMWSFLREGNFEVDAETKAQAQADIAEDGYWGVNQTSDRIIDFAVALTGGDTSKLGNMLEAFKKGYAQAEKTWGGELPEISQKTYDAVLEKFDKLINGESEM